MKLHDIKTEFPLKFDVFGNPVLSEYQKVRINRKSERKPDPRRWFKFRCQDCGHEWKGRSRPDREKYCPDCRSHHVARTLLGKGSGNSGTHARKKKAGTPGVNLIIHLDSRRTELVQAYLSDPNHRVDLEVDAQ